ncbi:HlyD family efflux transporter periplasmic adaptor subunit [Piscinibacter gummiphilus]|uniref:HlyD family efflux transporter periplasmic adaptor subunit n=1 Tax=Piscinibacter gummiphilus TaxID=946333 RepID=A0ABZ0D2G8_9BURK|nr:HlyD family efflux transporter periplasmic adaptor subunit [Piscinibacter gummiphilus]WOB11357.1 HlyD family efflux transporter periplasmic adaptor subunit [Piscinibacter gummiphilus]
MRSTGQPFRNSLVALEYELRRDRIGVFALVLASVLIGAAAWLFLAKINLYAISNAARIERKEIQPVVAPAAGVLAFSKLELGRQVTSGELIAELEHAVETRQLEEEELRLAALGSRLVAVRAELANEMLLLERETNVAKSQVEAVHSRVAQTKSAVGLAEAELAQSNRLGEMVAEMDRVRRRSLAEQQKALLAVAEAEARRATDEVVVRQNTVRVRIDRIKQTLVELEGAQSTAGAAVEVARRRVELRKIYASRAGKIIGIGANQVGSAVAEGERLATILPNGTLTIVADYAPQEAVGRVSEGQLGTMRVGGFPWAEFGMLEGRVTRAAAEPHNGLIRVELALDDQKASRIPLQHGLSGSVEIVVAQMTPISLFRAMLGDLVRPNEKPTR